MTTVSRTARRTAAALATVIALGGGLAATPASAHAHTSQRVHRTARVAAVSAYWTRARMRAAIPLDAARTTTGLTTNTLPNGSGGVVAPKEVGKLFFTDRNRDYVCSATAILTRSRNQVLTAGHCAHTGPHPDGGLLGTGLLAGAPRYYSNWVFVPRYRDGVAPYGKWVATKAYVAGGWAYDEDFSRDQAILTVARLGGKRLTDVVGGEHVALGRSPAERGVRIWGWPAASPYDGATAWRCDGATQASSISVKGDSAMTCGLNGGASGGPWFLPDGTVYAVTSRITTTGPHVILAQPLPRSLHLLIARAGG